MAKKKPATTDSAAYKVTLYGILNAQGEFWAPIAFESENAAREHISRFWGYNHASRDTCLRTHRIVPVRVQLTEIVDA